MLCMGPHKESCGKENKHNPADKSRIAPAFIWTHSAWLRLDPNETAACPGWIHHRQIRVIALRPCPSTFNQAPLRSLPICSSPSLEPSASISGCRQVQGAPTEECITCYESGSAKEWHICAANKHKCVKSEIN